MTENEAVAGGRQVVKEYLLLMRDDNVRLLLDEVCLRSIGNKTSCVVELTKRVLNRRVAGLRVVKYVIVRVVGEDEAAVRLCNRLLESRLPSYRLRREYVRRAECCTLYPGETAPDNTALYFSFQRSGAASCHYGDVLLNSPYEPSLLRPRETTCWKAAHDDLCRGLVITQRKQLESYLGYRLSRCAVEGLRKSNSQDTYFDPKAPIRYMYDDYEDLPNNSNYPDRKVIKKVSKYRDYPSKKEDYIKSINSTNVTPPFAGSCIIRKIPRLQSRSKKKKHFAEENVLNNTERKVSLIIESELIKKIDTTELTKIVERNSKKRSDIYKHIEGKIDAEIIDCEIVNVAINSKEELESRTLITEITIISSDIETSLLINDIVNINIHVQSLEVLETSDNQPEKDDDIQVLLGDSIDRIIIDIIYNLYDEKTNEFINGNVGLLLTTYSPIERNIIDYCIIEISEEIITMIRIKLSEVKGVSSSSNKVNVIKKNDNSCCNNCFTIIKIEKDASKWIINEGLKVIIKSIYSSESKESLKSSLKPNKIIKSKSSVSINDNVFEGLEVQLSHSVLNSVIEDSVNTLNSTLEKNYDVELITYSTGSDSLKIITSNLVTKKKSDSVILNKKDSKKNDESLISHTMINIIAAIIEKLLHETFHKCERSSKERLYFLEPMKNPSARLMEIRNINEKSPLKREIIPPTCLGTKVHVSATIQKPPETVSYHKERPHCLMHHQENILNIENEAPKVRDVIINKIVYSSSDNLDPKSNPTSSDFTYKCAIEKYANKFSHPKVSSSLVYDSQNSLNTKPSKKCNEHQVIRIDDDDTKSKDYIYTKGNCHVINVELDNDCGNRPTDFGPNNKHFYHLHHVTDMNRLINKCQIPDACKPTQVIEIGSRYSDIVEIEDSLEIILNPKCTPCSKKVNHKVELKSTESHTTPENLYETIQTAYLVSFQFAQEDSNELERVLLSSEFIIPNTLYYPTMEEWRIDELRAPINHINICPMNLSSSKETFGERYYLTDLSKETDTAIKYTDVILSHFTTPERCSVTSRCNFKTSPEFYTTVSIDNDQEVCNFVLDSELKCDCREITTQFSTIDDVISSMTNDLEEEEEDCGRYENFVVEREKVILIMKSTCGSPTNIIKVQQLKKSCPNDNVERDVHCPSNPEVSETETSFTEIIKSILHNTSNDSKYKASTNKTTSFSPDNNNSFSDIIESQKNTTQTSQCKPPSVKKTLLDLSKEVKCKRRQKQMNVLDEKEEFEETKIEGKDENENIVEKSVVDSKKNDFSNNSQSTAASNGSFTIFSKMDSSKIKFKPRSRSLSDRIKFVAKQFISKFNILNKKSKKDSTLSDISAASRRSCILTELSSKSSIDSKLSKNSLARYWNIHRFDSVKRMKVKGFVLLPPPSQQLISG